MKKYITLVIVCLMAISVSLQAQRPPHHGGKQHLEKMKEHLQLTTEQVQQVEALEASMKEEMKALKESGLEREEMHAKMKEMHESRKAEMEQILTPEQREKMEEHHAQREGKKGDFQKGGDPEKRAQRMEAMKERKAQIHQFMTTKVKPFMTDQRAALDKEMKKKDRKKVNQLRDLAKELHLEMKAKKDEMKQRFEKEEKPDFKPEGKMRQHKGPRHHKMMPLKKFMSEHEEEYKQAEEYATKYADEIDRHLEEIETQMKAWKSEMKTEHKGEKPAFSDKGDRQFKKRENCEKPAPSAERQEKMKMMKRIGFLLMPSEMETEMMGNRETKELATLSTKVFPNPTSNSNTIEVNISKKGKYLIELYNEQGQKLRVINDTKLEKGQQRFEVDLSDLPNGMYYYIITDGQNKQIEKFVKN